MPFANPILGGTTLIREAIKSPNYSAGATGWFIGRDGSAEFNNITVRGTVVTDTVTIDDNGVHVVDPTTNARVDIEPTGSGVESPKITMSPAPNVSLPDLTQGAIVTDAGIQFPGPIKYGQMILTAPSPDGVEIAQIQMRSDDTAVPSSILIVAQMTYVSGELSVSNAAEVLGKLRINAAEYGTTGIGIPYGQPMASFNIVVAAGAVAAVSAVINYPVAFPVGTAVRVTARIDSAAGGTTRWDVRPINVTNTGCQFRVFSTDNVAAPVGGLTLAIAPDAWAYIPLTP